MTALYIILAALTLIALGYFVSKRLLKLEREKAAWDADKKNLELRAKEYQESIGKIKEEMLLHFESLSNKIFDAKSKNMQEVSEKNISNLLGPLKEKIQEFQKKVETVYSDESKERYALKQEIANIVKESQKMSSETNNLTKALKSDSKTQGVWGELVLETVLEASGLVKGEEYVLQAEEMGLKDELGKTQKPDVVINLPESRHLIIDSKVSLVSYERYVSEEDETKRAVHLGDFLKSLYAHVEGLAGRNYQLIEKLNSPDFVMMFIPIEGAFSLAVQKDKEIFTYAWSKNVGIVSPNNLLATLRTVSSLWKMENQNKHAKEIARQSAALYDKFASLLEDIEEIGKHLDLTRRTYDDAVNKLKYGKGNLLNRVESLKKLGVKPSKSLPLSDEADINE
ncbi:MAG: DNA recombination protein RmuC [Pseudomonadota bacterium]